MKSYTIKPHEIIVIDSVITAQIPLSEKRYSLELIKKAKKRKLKDVQLVIPATLPSTVDSKTWL